MKIKNILISQPAPADGKSPYFEMEKQYGVHVFFHQFIQVESLTPKEFRAQHINILDYTALLFSSVKAVDIFFHLCEEMRVAIPDTMHYYCISDKVAYSLQKYINYRKRKVFFPLSKVGVRNEMKDLVPMMTRHNTDKFLLIAADVNNKNTIQMFADNKLEVRTAIAYHTVPRALTPEEKQDYDMYVLFTPTGVEGFLQSYPDFKQDERVIACYGAATVKALQAAGLRVDVMAPNAQYTAVSMAVDAFLQENHKRIR